MDNKEYVESLGFHCPNCHSTNVTASDIDLYGCCSATRVCECLDCGAYWDEVWGITGFENLQTPGE